MSVRELPANRSPAAVALRAAALRFGHHATSESADDHDTKGQRLNRELLLAALSYATAVEKAQRPPLGRSQRALLTYLRTRAPRGADPRDTGWPKISIGALVDLRDEWGFIEWAWPLYRH